MALLPAGVFGLLAANLLVGDAPATALALAACNGVEVGLCAWLIHRVAGDGVDLSRHRHLIAFLAAATLSPLISGAGASTILSLAQAPSDLSARWLSNLKDWYAADALGLLIVTPALLTLTPETLKVLGRALSRPWGWLSPVVLTLVLATVFSRSSGPIYFLIPGALILAAFQLGQAGAALSLLITALACAVMTMTGHGSMSRFGRGLADRLDMVQIFIATMVMIVFPVAAALAKQQRLEVDLREADRLSDLARQIAEIGHWRNDLRTGGFAWSDQTYDIHGLPRSEDKTEAPPGILLYPIEDRVRIRETLDKAIATGEPFTLKARLTRADDGRERIVMFKGEAEYGSNGQVCAVFGVMRDITDQETARLRIEASEARYRTLTESAADMIIESTLDGVLTYVSPACLAVTGYTQEEAVGQLSPSMMYPEDAEALRQMCLTVLKSNGTIAPWPVAYRVTHKDGHEIWLESKPVMIHDPVTGHGVGMTDVIRDITDRKTLELELRQARADAEASAAVKGEFLANMSHELRTPLTSVIGFTRMAAAQDDLSPMTRDYVDRVGEASRALLCTVNDILDFSKLEAGQVNFEVQPTALRSLTRATLDLFAPQAGAKDLHLTLDDSEAGENLVIAVDPDRVRQILLNFVSNAVKFTTSGGVTLKTAYDDTAQRLSVSVIDTGGGIAQDNLDLLFKRFSQVDGSLTRTNGGTGLGLAICKGLVEAMGGQIGVESVIGQGSRFWFEIPAARAAMDDVAEDQDGGEALSFAGMRVLVADDHPSNRDLARLFLNGVGAEVFEAADGLLAVSMAEEAAYDVILMDVRMPNLDGPGALRQIRAGAGPNRTTPILAYTADADPITAGKLTDRGFQGVVSKPVEPGALISAVARALISAADDEVTDAGALAG
jgi:PAS domain S-box-containing protein